MPLEAVLSVEDDIKDEVDSIGSSGPLESGLYEHTVKMAYMGESKGGAINMTLHLADPNGRELRTTVYLTSGKAKGQLNYYVDKRTKQKSYLPGFNIADSLCLLTVGKHIAELATEAKLVGIYNFDTRKEEPTQVPVVMDLLGKSIITGVIKQTVDKNKNVAAEGEAPDYQPTGETRDENEIDKFFRASDGLTTAEIRAKTTVAAFKETWAAKWTGNTRDKSTGTASPAAQAATVAAAKPTKSLFE